MYAAADFYLSFFFFEFPRHINNPIITASIKIKADGSGNRSNAIMINKKQPNPTLG